MVPFVREQLLRAPINEDDMRRKRPAGLNSSRGIRPGFSLPVLACVLALGLSAFPADRVIAQETTANAKQTATLLALAAQADWDTAKREAQLRLRDDPDDFTALVVLARASRAQGDMATAQTAARQANTVARTDEDRYVASIELASIQYGKQNFLRSQFWLRRAYQYAPTREMRAQTARDIRSTQIEAPWQAKLRIGITPSSNVNNGSLADTVEIGGLDFVLNPDAKALAGLEMTASASLRYRFGDERPYPSYVSLSLFTKKVSLSSSAEANLADAKGSDYNYDAIEFGFGHDFSRRSDRLHFRIDAAVGRNYYGTKPLSRFLKTSVTASTNNGRNMETTVMLSAERLLRDDERDRSAWITELSALRGWRLSSGDALRLSGGLRHTASASTEIDHDAIFIGGGYQFRTIFGGAANLTLDMELEYRDYAASLFRAGGRQDLRTRVGIELGFPTVQYYGFTPIVAIDLNKTRSNVDFYDSKDIGVRLEARSVF